MIFIKPGAFLNFLTYYLKQYKHSSQKNFTQLEVTLVPHMHDETFCL